MTAARSDLMALDPLEMLLDAARFADSIKPEWAKAARKAVAAARLAASQPDREAIKQAITENIDYGYERADHLSQRIFGFEEATDAILSLLSGAGTKSDGRTRDSLSSGENEPVVTRACGPSDPSPGHEVKPAPIADSSEAGRGDPLDDLVARFSAALLEKLKAARIKYEFGGELWRENDWEADCQQSLLSHLAKGDPRDVAAYCAFMWHHGWSTVAPALSAPVGGATITGASLQEAWRKYIELFGRPPHGTEPQLSALLTLVSPAPAVSPDVRVSKHDDFLTQARKTTQFLDEAAAALTRPLGGFVQGSIGTKQSTDPEGGSRTETAGANVRLFVECERCGGSGFSSLGAGYGYDDVCSECGGLRFTPFEAAGKRPVPSVSGDSDRKQQRNTMGVTAGETAPNSSAVAETDADAQRDDGLLSGGEA